MRSTLLFAAVALAAYALHRWQEAEREHARLRRSHNRLAQQALKAQRQAAALQARVDKQDKAMSFFKDYAKRAKLSAVEQAENQLIIQEVRNESKSQEDNNVA